MNLIETAFFLGFLFIALAVALRASQAYGLIGFIAGFCMTLAACIASLGAVRWFFGRRK